MKNEELLRRLHEVQKLKSKAKKSVQEAFDTIHQLELTVTLWIQEIQQLKKRREERGK